MKTRKTALAFILLTVIVLPRLASLKSFVSLDEPFWLSVGANFYYALGQREFQNTVYEYHPAVTTMWFVTAGMLVYFPEYRGFGQGYFEVDKEKFDPFLIEHGISPLQLLFFSRLFQLVLITLLGLMIFFSLTRLVPAETAFLAAGLMASSPFFLGHSLLLNHEALLALCMLASMLGMLVYLEFGRKPVYLALSATAGGLAQLTKSSAIVLFPVIGLILALSLFERTKDSGFGRAGWDHVKVFLLWFAALTLVYFVLWPGMWVAPGRMLYEVYGNAFSYAFQGARLQVTQELQPAAFNLAAAGPVISGYITNLLWRSTPITWLGVVLAIGTFFLKGNGSTSAALKRLMGYLLITALLFILMFGLAQGRNQLHYIMTSHASLDAIAGLGLGSWIAWLGARWKVLSKPMYQPAATSFIVALQLWSALAFYPYYYTYYNPLASMITGGRPGYGYGEGMELAAAYLSSKPDAELLTVLAYHGRGPFSYYFPGQTILLNPLWLDEPGMASMVERLKLSDYLVFYEEFGTRSERTQLFVNALAGIQPEKVISVQGVEQILIYRVTELTPEFYEVISHQ